MTDLSSPQNLSPDKEIKSENKFSKYNEKEFRKIYNDGILLVQNRRQQRETGKKNKIDPKHNDFAHGEIPSREINVFLFTSVCFSLKINLFKSL